MHMALSPCAFVPKKLMPWFWSRSSKAVTCVPLLVSALAMSVSSSMRPAMEREPPSKASE